MVYHIADNVTSPLGNTTEQNYLSVKSGNSALRYYENHWGLPEPFTAALFTAEQNQAMAIDNMTRFESLVIHSARQAIDQSGINVSAPNVVFVLGTTKGNIEELEDNRLVPSIYYPGDTAQRIALKLGFTTTPVVACNACISGVSAIILAMRLLEKGAYDYAVVCGADVQNKFTVSGFQSLKAVSQEPCRPFDLERLGLNLGEAAATLVLSSDRVAQQGDHWCIESGAVRNDAFHVSSPSKNGEGARLALCGTRADSVVGQLAFINAHGTATMFNDQMESVAIERAGLNDVPVNALKGYYGHTMGAAGVLETVISIRAAQDNMVLGTRGFSERGVSGKIRLSSQNQQTDKESFVKMISGFGGSNAALLVSKAPILPPDDELPSDYTRTHHVVLTPDQLMVDGEQREIQPAEGDRITAIYKQMIGNYPKIYKMDMLSRLALVATELLLQAEGAERFTASEDRAVVLFNHSSSIQADRAYLATIADKEGCFPSPSIFVYTLPNMATSEVAMRNLFHGETSLYILPCRDEKAMKQVIEASMLDKSTHSMITGWLDYEDNDHFIADISIIQNLSTRDYD
ncbi:MAG: 3-oxoacyl-ACP synthase [Muribaculaceae bacterium]|nr:3-oxoacyl-ACP synthase [Muribaculaceae bacterium]